MSMAATGSIPVDDVPTIHCAIQALGLPKVFLPKARIYGEDEPARNLYQVISGAVRIYRVLANGQRQISAFCLPGDFFGLGVGEKNAFSAEAIAELRVLIIKRSTLIALAGEDNEIFRQLWTLIGQELNRTQEHMLLFGMRAPERIAAFLLQMAERLSCHNSVPLPMSRQDIADYLGLTIETVSRQFTHLERTAMIGRATARLIVVHNRLALSQQHPGRTLPT